MTAPTTAVLMAGGNVHGRMLVQAMVEAGVGPTLVLDEQGSERARKLARFLANAYDNPPPLSALTTRVETVSSCMGEDAVARLRRLSLDYLILGGCGVVRQPLLGLATPLNAHPGLLPQYRGLDPVPWAVSRGDSVGATLHVVTEGIDEGPILLREELPWRGAATLLELRLQCMRLGAALLARFLRDPALYRPQEQDARAAAYYGSFPEAAYGAAEARLAAYRAVAGGNRFMPAA